MPRDIDPKSDFAFKLIFGTTENIDLLLDLITAIVQPRTPIVELRHVDPATRAAFADDDVTVVDVAARDADGVLYQVEVQVDVRPVLRNRIVYGSIDVLQGQIRRGSDWAALRPVIAIWILAQNLFHDAGDWRHRFRVRSDRGLELSRSLEIHVVELRKWRRRSSLDNADRWAYFLRDATAWDHLPADCTSPSLEKAMSILDDIAKDQELFAAHRRKMAEIERVSRANEIALLQAALQQTEAAAEHERAEKERERAEKERERAEKERERAEKERLVVLLRAAGLDPDG